MTDREYFLPFSVFPGIGPVKFEKLIKHFGTARNAWEAPSAGLRILLGEKLTAKFEKFRLEFDIPKFKKQLHKKKIDYVCLLDKQYPSLLKQIPNPPILLFVKGDKGLLTQDPAIAVVGTRKMTGYGQEITELFACQLTDAGFIIVSGMAIGVDGQAHKSCLESGGKTIAVLGNGVDLPFPSSNAHLYDRILKEKGLIISEFPPGEPPSKGTFPSRNRIIAGMSQAVLVTQGASDSGSLITAKYGLQFGRPVFAIPGPITSSLSAAPLRLIEKGAKLVVSPDDILRNFQLSISNFQSAKDSVKFANLNKEEKKIVEILENESLNFDEIVRRLRLDPSKTGSTLSVMEIKGILKNSGGNYSITS